MGFKICHNCGESVVTLTEKCPKCGIIPKKSMSPVFMGIIIVVLLLILVGTGIIFF